MPAGIRPGPLARAVVAVSAGTVTRAGPDCAPPLGLACCGRITRGAFFK